MSAPIPLIVLTNGRRDCISRTIPSAREHLTGVGSITIVNDSSDPDYRQWLEDEFIGSPLDCAVAHSDGEHGYWWAMKAVWMLARHQMSFFGTDSVFFLEDDFVFHDDIDLTCLDRVLDEQKHLTQIALLRQPWWPNEIKHGGLIPALEVQGQRFEEFTDGTHHWVEHRACFTGNPTLLPRRTFEHDWPKGTWSESRFGRLLFSDPLARGAYWGHRSDPPRVEHIGHERVGTDY